MRSQRLRTAFFRSRRRRDAPSEPGRIAAKSPSPATAREGVAPSKPCRLKVAHEGSRRVSPGANGNFFRHPGFNQPTGGRRPANGVPRPGPTARRSRTAEGAGGAVARKRPQSPSERSRDTAQDGKRFFGGDEWGLPSAGELVPKARRPPGGALTAAPRTLPKTAARPPWRTASCSSPSSRSPCRRNAAWR